MKRMLFNATQAEELRVAIVDGQKLIDFDVETIGKEQLKGNIYKGVITRIEPSLEACFVDYGTDRHGFLPFKEVSRVYFQDYDGGRPRIQEVLREGMDVLVQIEKDERGNKGAALTTYISLAGRYVVLMPNNPRGGGVSRRIEGEERQELKALMAQLEVPSGMSLIARTAGIGHTLEELQWDLNYLLQLWNAIISAVEVEATPSLIFQESILIFRAIRDYFQPDIGDVLVDSPEIYEEIKDFMSRVMPDNAAKVRPYSDHVPLFSRFQIEQQIETAYSRSVPLPSGGAIVIDHTEALVSIDVNSARSTRGSDIEETAFRTNLEAAEEIARQLRLRDLGGLVVIDFIDMEFSKNQHEVESRLREAIRADRARVQMGKLSRFGLLELSRQRLQPSLGESSHIICPRCHGVGFIRGIESSALHILRVIQEEALKENTGAVHVQVPVDVATFLLNEKRIELYSLEDRLDVRILLIPNIHLETPGYDVKRVRYDDLDDLDDEPSYKRVEMQEQEVWSITDKLQTKTETQKAAVKGIKHGQAPVVKPELGLLARVASWFKGETSVTSPVKTESTGRNASAKTADQRIGINKRRQNSHGPRRQENSQGSREKSERYDNNGRRNGRRSDNDIEKQGKEREVNGRRNEYKDREDNTSPKNQRRTSKNNCNNNQQKTAESVTVSKVSVEADQQEKGSVSRQVKNKGNDRRRRRSRQDAPQYVENNQSTQNVAESTRTEDVEEVRLPVKKEVILPCVASEAMVSVSNKINETMVVSVEPHSAAEKETYTLPAAQDKKPTEEGFTEPLDTIQSGPIMEEIMSKDGLIQNFASYSEVAVEADVAAKKENVSVYSSAADTRVGGNTLKTETEKLEVDLGGLIMVSTSANTNVQENKELSSEKGIRRRDLLPEAMTSDQSGAELTELVQIETKD